MQHNNLGADRQTQTDNLNTNPQKLTEEEQAKKAAREKKEQEERQASLERAREFQTSHCAYLRWKRSNPPDDQDQKLLEELRKNNPNASGFTGEQGLRLLDSGLYKKEGVPFMLYYNKEENSISAVPYPKSMAEFEQYAKESLIFLALQGHRVIQFDCKGADLIDPGLRKDKLREMEIVLNEAKKLGLVVNFGPNLTTLHHQFYKEKPKVATKITELEKEHRTMDARNDAILKASQDLQLERESNALKSMKINDDASALRTDAMEKANKALAADLTKSRYHGSLDEALKDVLLKDDLFKYGNKKGILEITPEGTWPTQHSATSGEALLKILLDNQEFVRDETIGRLSQPAIHPAAITQRFNKTYQDIVTRKLNEQAAVAGATIDRDQALNDTKVELKNILNDENQYTQLADSVEGKRILKEKLTAMTSGANPPVTIDDNNAKEYFDKLGAALATDRNYIKAELEFSAADKTKNDPVQQKIALEHLNKQGLDQLAASVQKTQEGLFTLQNHVNQTEKTLNLLQQDPKNPGQKHTPSKQEVERLSNAWKETSNRRELLIQQIAKNIQDLETRYQLIDAALKHPNATSDHDANNPSQHGPATQYKKGLHAQQENLKVSIEKMKSYLEDLSTKQSVKLSKNIDQLKQTVSDDHSKKLKK